MTRQPLWTVPFYRAAMTVSPLSKLYPQPVQNKRSRHTPEARQGAESVRFVLCRFHPLRYLGASSRIASAFGSQ